MHDKFVVSEKFNSLMVADRSFFFKLTFFRLFSNLYLILFKDFKEIVTARLMPDLCCLLKAKCITFPFNKYD